MSPAAARTGAEGRAQARCILCTEAALKIGGSVLDDAMLQKMAQHPAIGPMFKVARDSFAYEEQFLFACTYCGFVFVSPVLSDEETTRLMFEAIGGEWVRSREWGKPAIARRALPVWYSAVRTPSVDDSLRGLLPTRPLRVLDVGGHEGEISINMDLPPGSAVDITQLENSGVWFDTTTSDREVRTFNGLTYHLRESHPDYRADLVLAINVLEHTADPNGFLQDCRALMKDDGLLVVEVPYEPWDGMDLALSLNYQLAHHLYFFPWSIRFALERNGLCPVQLEVLPHAHTGVVPLPSTQMRAVCKKAEGTRPVPPQQAFSRSLDALIGSFGATLAFQGAVEFVAFVFDPRCQDLLEIFRRAPNFKGVVTTNEELEYPNLFSGPEIEADYLIILKPQDRETLRQHYHGPYEVI